MVNLAVNVANCMAGGGLAIANWFVGRLTEYDPPKCIQVSLIINSLHKESIHGGRDWRVLEVHRSPLRSRTVRKKVHEFLRSTDTDVVFSLFGPSGISHPNQIGGIANAFVTSDQRKLLRRLHPYTWPIHQEKYSMMRRMMSRYQKLLFETHSERQQFISLTGYPPERTEVLGNSVDDAIVSSAAFSYSEAATDKFRILLVTAPYKHKNNHLLGRYRDAVESIVGPGNFEFQVTLTEDSLKKAVGDEGGAISGFRCLGHIPPKELAARYRDADLVIHPSSLETYSAVYNEVRFFGTPLLCSRLPPAVEICGDFALFFHPENIEEFSERIKEVLSDGRSLAQAAWDARTKVIGPGEKFESMLKFIMDYASTIDDRFK